MQTKAVIFDLDNTLIDFMKMKRTSCEAAISAMINAGLKLDKQKALKILFELYDKYGLEYGLIFQKFLQKINKKIDYKILASGIIAYRKAQAGVLEPYPNVVPTLIKLRARRLKLAILSDAPRLKAWLRLVEMKLDNFFDIVICFEDTRKFKPDKEPFLLALKKLNLKPEECLMVGDNPKRDLMGAKVVGIKTVFAKYGSLSKTKAKPDYVINSFEELLGLV